MTVNWYRGIFVLAVSHWFMATEAKDRFDIAESELTITLGPGKIECFHQPAKEGHVLEVEYQVLDSNFGNMDVNPKLEIDFYMKSPTDKELIADRRRTDAVHRHEVKEAGDHTICFDNTISAVSKKTVYFEVYVDSDTDEDRWDNVNLQFTPELVYNDTVDIIKTTIKKVHENLNRIKHFQDQFRTTEVRHRNLQEHNFSRVNNFSFLFIVVMVVVGAIQVAMVRSLFDERSSFHKVLKRLS